MKRLAVGLLFPALAIAAQDLAARSHRAAANHQASGKSYHESGPQLGKWQQRTAGGNPWITEYDFRYVAKKG